MRDSIQLQESVVGDGRCERRELAIVMQLGCELVPVAGCGNDQ